MTPPTSAWPCRTPWRAAFALPIVVSAALACDDHPSAGPSGVPAPVASARLVAGERSATPAPPSAAVAAPPPQVRCAPPPALTFVVPELEAEVRRRLAKPDKALTVADLKSVKTIDLSKAKVDRLDPCVMPLLTAVRGIYLGPGDLSDLSPIAGLTNLEYLRASINHVADVTPLTKLVKLDRLDLGRTAVRDLTPLANLVNLTELQLDDTEVTDLTPLAQCTKLERLSLKRTQVKELTPLKDLTKLRFLYLDGTPAPDTGPLGPLVTKGLRVMSH